MSITVYTMRKPLAFQQGRTLEFILEMMMEGGTNLTVDPECPSRSLELVQMYPEFFHNAQDDIIAGKGAFEPVAGGNGDDSIG